MQLSIALGVMATVVQALTAPPPAAPVFNTWVVPRAPLAPPQPSTPAPEPAVRGSRGPMVVCGTVVVAVDAAVDPGLVRPVPTDRAFTMRTVKPPLCRD